MSEKNKRDYNIESFFYKKFKKNVMNNLIYNVVIVSNNLLGYLSNSPKSFLRMF
jgi:hypothetical protein